MPFALDLFARQRPFVYHLTSPDNIDSIRSARRLECAADFIKNSGSDDLLQKQRKPSCYVRASNTNVRLQSQSPLHPGNVAFEDGWSLSDLIACLNGLVFFWPGTESSPNRYGENHFKSRSWSERPIALRVPTAELLESNRGNRPLFCRFNSGSPRCVKGRKSPRGPNTFLPADRFEGTLSEVAELVFSGNVHLPDATEFRLSPDCPWRPFFEGE
jgi:hypothetical protein